MMSAVVSAGLSVVFQEFLNKFQKKLDVLKPKDIQIVNVKQDPDSYSITVLDDVSTTSKKFGNLKDNPDIEFKNELEKESIVKEITIIPNTAFKTKGKIIITVNDVPVFKSKSFTAFQNIISSIIKINKTISQDKKVKVFIVNDDDITSVGVSIQVTFGDD